MHYHYVEGRNMSEHKMAIKKDAMRMSNIPISGVEGFLLHQSYIFRYHLVNNESPRVHDLEHQIVSIVIKYWKCCIFFYFNTQLRLYLHCKVNLISNNKNCKRKNFHNETVLCYTCHCGSNIHT